jgi:hypothetical protein
MLHARCRRAGPELSDASEDYFFGALPKCDLERQEEVAPEDVVLGLRLVFNELSREEVGSDRDQLILREADRDAV